MPSSRAVLLFAGLCVSLPAQMSGVYLVNPTAPPPAYPTISAAVNALFINGINGPVEVLIVPGSYLVSMVVPPIAGVSATNTVTLRSLLGPGTVHITGTSDNFALLGADFMPNAGMIFDGLDFDGSSSLSASAISGTPYVEGVEVRNCRFAAGYRYHLSGQDEMTASGWRVHHCRFSVPPFRVPVPPFQVVDTGWSIYLASAHTWQIHHNAFELNQSSGAIYLGNNNSGLLHIYDNLFSGSVFNYNATFPPQSGGQWPFYGAVVRSDLACYGNDIVNNTFVVSIPNEGCCVGIAQGNFVAGNVFVLTGAGTCINADATASGSNCNLFWAPNGEVARRHTGNNPVSQGFTALAAWAATSGQDGYSIAADPLLVNTATRPFDLHPGAGSPVRDPRPYTRLYVTTDQDDRFRDDLPDLGAYEMPTFARFGSGCPGTGGVPALAGNGQVALGGTVTVTLGGALANSFALLAGNSRLSAGNLGPAFDLGGGCLLLVAPDAVAGSAVSATGTASILLHIPNNSALAGSNHFFQWLVVDAAAGSRYGVAVSNAGALQL